MHKVGVEVLCSRCLSRDVCCELQGHSWEVKSCNNCGWPAPDTRQSVQVDDSSKCPICGKNLKAHSAKGVMDAHVKLVKSMAEGKK